jgi:outer membrane protein assembly factor BamB
MTRREFLSLAPAVCLVQPGAVAQKPDRIAPAHSPSDRWVRFRGTPSLTGFSAATIPSSLQRLWIWEGGETVDSSPAILDGVVYVGTGTGELIALSLADGSLKWRYKAGESIGESSPMVAGPRVYIGDLEGVVHAVNVADGKAAWTFKTQSEIKSSPVLAGDNVVLIGSYDGNLYGLGGDDGKQRWAVKTENYVHGTPCVVDGVAHFAGCDEVFHAVRVNDGREVFTASATAYTGASVAMHEGVAYFGTFDNQVVAFDVKKRAVKWRYEHPERKFPFYSSAAIWLDTVLVGGRDRMLHALDAATGKARWTHMTRARIDSSPAVAGDRVYVGSSDGRFYVLDLASGKVLWEYEDGGPLTSSPALASGRIVIGSGDGRVLCFG